ncbi:hypothetical protein GCM10010515_28100 [Streptomyces fructofermentans]|uniref:Uncharacterized protein n=1 Tax=Streptomyces fructofermentans TaxID=152141 RepID=A0A918KCT4_9ACTN|nr:hypothetical protein GCM10010515_28100 [Streptomyces fructofermentans]
MRTTVARGVCRVNATDSGHRRTDVLLCSQHSCTPLPAPVPIHLFPLIRPSHPTGAAAHLRTTCISTRTGTGVPRLSSGVPEVLHPAVPGRDHAAPVPATPSSTTCANPSAKGHPP